jgi:hypothetical protein
MFSSLNAWYTIPVIIISTVTGTANFAQERVPSKYQNYFVMLVGAFNITAGIITTIQQFLKITQLNEAHRVSSIAWDKFYRSIKTEIAKHPYERIDVTQSINMRKEEFDRLIETSPNIPEKIIEQFKNSFNNKEVFKQIVRPEICDILVPTNDYKNRWYNDEKRWYNENRWYYDENRAKRINDNLRLEIIKNTKEKRIIQINKKKLDENKSIV